MQELKREQLPNLTLPEAFHGEGEVSEKIKLTIKED
jgi:hypothetical protein